MHLLKYSAGKNISGYSIITDPYAKLPNDEGETLSCCHCQFTWTVKPNSGLERGWCFLCNKPTCHKKACRESCAPWEAQIEEIESKQTFWMHVGRLR